MSVSLYNGDLGHFQGQILASWFIANPNGPTAFAIGIVELNDQKKLYYRWFHFLGGKTWLLNTLDDELFMWDERFEDVFINSMLQANDYFSAKGCEFPTLMSIPSIIFTNNNAKINDAINLLIKIRLPQEDWGRELYYCRKYKNNFFARFEEQYREFYEIRKLDNNSSKDFLENFWYENQHRKGFQEWKPNQYQSQALDDKIFSEWKSIIFDSNFRNLAIYQFCQMWIGSSKIFIESKHPTAESQTIVALQSMLNFFENHNLPLLPKDIDEAYIRSKMNN